MMMKPMNGATDDFRRALWWRRAPFDETIETTTGIEPMVPLRASFGVGFRWTATDVDLQTLAEGIDETVDGARSQAEDWLYGHVDAGGVPNLAREVGDEDGCHGLYVQ